LLQVPVELELDDEFLRQRLALLGGVVLSNFTDPAAELRAAWWRLRAEVLGRVQYLVDRSSKRLRRRMNWPK